MLGGSDVGLFGAPKEVTAEEDFLPLKEKSAEASKRLFKAISLINERRPLNIDDVVDSGESKFDPFITNRALSLFQDTVIAAAAMNQRSHLAPEMQVAFLLNSIRPRRRYSGKWPKASTDETIDLIARYYGMSHREAARLMLLHTDAELKTMRSIVGKDRECSRFR